MLQRQKNVHPHETIEVGILLAVVGGFLDAYTYLVRGGVFANAQTGNIVLLAISAATGTWVGVGYYIIPIIAFVMGVLATEWIKRRFTPDTLLVGEHIVLIIEIFLLFLLGFCPVTVPNWIVNAAISFVASVQVHSFQKVVELSYASTMCTGNLRLAGKNLFLYLAENNKEAGERSRLYFLIIAGFVVGAIAGTAISIQIKEKAIWGCCILLAITLGLSMRKEAVPR